MDTNHHLENLVETDARITADARRAIDTLTYDNTIAIGPLAPWHANQRNGCIHAVKQLFCETRKAIATQNLFDGYILGLPTTELNASLPSGAAEFVNNAYDQMVRMEKAHPGYQGKIELAIKISDGVFRFQVRDNGGGVPASAASRLFKEPICDGFYENSEKKKAQETDGIEGGCGLGLWCVRTYMDQLGGSYGWSNLPDGSGAEFFYEVPLKNIVKIYQRKPHSQTQAA